MSFLNQERERNIIALKETGHSKWSYFTHCAALCVLISVGICNAPLLHDYTVVYKGSLDGAILACVVGGILHLFIWIVTWLFLTIKHKWIFKIRVTVSVNLVYPGVSRKFPNVSSKKKILSLDSNHSGIFQTQNKHLLTTFPFNLDR